jgi:hypothetical protein
LREQGVDTEVCDLLDANATEIYTACSFQDITGQRTRKVIQVLRYLEDRINAMIGIWGLDGAMAAEAAEQRAVDGDKALLNGPAKPGTGLDQADVDMVMGPAGTRRAAAPPLAPSHMPVRPIEKPVITVRAVEVEVIDAKPVHAEVITARDVDGDVIEAEVVEVEAIAAPAVEPVVAAPVVAPVAAPAPRPASDPLAPIMTLSAEEKIALFS